MGQFLIDLLTRDCTVSPRVLGCLSIYFDYSKATETIDLLFLPLGVYYGSVHLLTGKKGFEQKVLLLNLLLLFCMKLKAVMNEVKYFFFKLPIVLLIVPYICVLLFSL